MPELIGEQIPQVLEIISSSFIFRKLGICYDLKALPDEFPRKSLPSAKEIKNNLPDSSGSYTAMSSSILNNALLFDGYSLRLEIGFADEKSEERVYDRLIGGAIRFSTIAPHNAIISSLSPDGKSFYPNAGYMSYIAWAFYAWRIAVTPTILLESQGKIKNIASRWIARLSSDNFVIPTEDNSLNNQSWQTEPLVAGILAASWILTGEEKWKKLALERASFKAELPTEATAEELLPQQFALHMLAEIFPEEEVGKNAKKRMLKILPLAVKLLAKANQFAPKDYQKEPTLDWHDLTPGEPLPESWDCYKHENETIAQAINAALVCLLTADKEALTPYASDLCNCINDKPWDKMRLAKTLCPVASIHARGVELGLWDEKIQEYNMGFDSDEALVSRYMAEDFDEQNLEKSGHTEAPKKELPPELQKEEEAQKNRNSKKRRRRRRKK